MSKMNMFGYILLVVCAILFGTAAAAANTLISKKALQRDMNNMHTVMASNTARMIVNIAALVITLAVCRLFGLPETIALISVVIGLSVSNFVFLKLLTKRMENFSSRSENGGA